MGEVWLAYCHHYGLMHTQGKMSFHGGHECARPCKVWDGGNYTDNFKWAIQGLCASNWNSGAPVPPASPHCLWFPGLKILTTRRHPVISRLLGGKRVARATHSGGRRWIQQGPRGETTFFPKVVPRPFALLKQTPFRVRGEAFWHSKMLKCLQNLPFWDSRKRLQNAFFRD